MKGKVTAWRARTWLANFSFVIPFLIFYAIFVLYPVVQAGIMSFFDWDLLGSRTIWLGTDNYTKMLGGTQLTWDLQNQWPLRLLLLTVAVGVAYWAVKSRRLGLGEGLLVGLLTVVAVALGVHPGEGGAWNDPRFWNAFANTIVFTLVSTPLIAGLGLAFALLLRRHTKMTAFYQAALFVPYVLPVSVATLIWGYMLNPSRGIVAWLTEHLGIGVIAWLSDPRFAMAAIVITTIWWTVGFNMILFTAGLQDIDPSLYEAASLDGAGRWSQFRHITLPGLQHATTLVLVTQIIASFQIFGQVNIMTGGGPGGSTDVLVRYIYQTGFRDMQLGYASALSLFLFAAMVLVSLIQFLMTKERSR